MFKTIIQKIRRWFYQMNLVKGIKSVSNLPDIPVDDAFYQKIDQWKSLYAGYLSDFHDVKYKTIAGEKERRRASLQMPKVVSHELASLIFNERCDINISDDALSENIKDVFDNNRFYKLFQDNLEYTFALGGLVIKPYVEDGAIKLSFVTADCFIPVSWDNKGIREGVFINITKKGDKTYTLLEWHLWESGNYVIRNVLYESQSGNELGVEVRLDTLYPDLEPELIIYTFTRPNFAYFKPNSANNIDLNSPLGVSVYANALDTLRSLDIAFDSFQREFVLGKKRILVPENAIKTVVNPENGDIHRYFDADDEVYQAFDFNDMDSNLVKEMSFELRVEEHQAAIQAFLNILAMQIGFSPGAFTFDGQGVKTATEVVSENSKTFRTKQSHENVIEAGLQELIECIVQTADMYGLWKASEDYEVTVAFDDSIAEDQTAEINRQILLITNKLQTRKKAIMKIYGYTDEEAEQLVKEILEDSKTITPENIDFFGMGGE